MKLITVCYHACFIESVINMNEMYFYLKFICNELKH